MIVPVGPATILFAREIDVLLSQAVRDVVVVGRTLYLPPEVDLTVFLIGLQLGEA